MRTRLDFLVLGGGPAGSAVAALLARTGARVALVENTDFRRFRAGEHLPPKIRDALATLGCGPETFDDILADSPGIRSQWAADVPVFRPYASHERGAGMNVLRNAFDERLFRHAETCGALALSATSSLRLEHEARGWTATGESRGTAFDLFAPILIDATGRRSRAARDLGKRATAFGDMTAIVAVLAPSNEELREPPWLIVEACETGWCSQTQLPDGRRVVAFYTSSQVQRTLGRATAAVWQRGVSQTTLIASRGARRHAPELLARFPVFPRILETAHGEDWLAVGEAAAAYDPVSGHGIAFALETAFRAAEMASSDAPLATVGPLYDEALRSKMREHLWRRREVYCEAAHRFPESPFWSEFAALA